MKTYPDLADHAGLREALLLAAQAEKGAVKKVRAKQSASNVEATGPIAAALTLAARHSEGQRARSGRTGAGGGGPMAPRFSN